MRVKRIDPPLNAVPEDSQEDHRLEHTGPGTSNGSVMRDPLVAQLSEKPSPSYHVKTYTAGEDTSRLAAVAKELGLRNARKPREQVRRRTPTLSLKGWQEVLTDTATEDARIRSVYTSHQDYDRDFYVSTEWTKEEQEQDEEAAEEEVYDAHAAGMGGSLLSAVFGVIKVMVGPAILYLPHGFATAGYAAALPIMTVSTTLFLYSSNCLLQSWKVQNRMDKHKLKCAAETTHLLKDSSRKNKKGPLPLSYPELAYRALGPKGESIVKTGIALMQSGVCLTYLIFVPQNLSKSVAVMTGVDISPNLWLVLMIAIEIPLSWLRDIRKLTPTNVLANALILYGLIVCLAFALREATTPDDTADLAVATVSVTQAALPQNQEDFNAWVELKNHLAALKPLASQWFLFLGTSVLLFEGTITLLVPLQESVHSEEDRKRFPVVYQRVLIAIICFYAVFGMTCWMAFGNDVRTVLTTSLPETAMSTTVQLAYSIAVIFTFPLQNFPALEIATRTISSSLSKYPLLKCMTNRNVLSSLLVCALAVVALLTMDSLDKVVSLMGSLLGCPIAFVFPPLIHSQLDPHLSQARVWTNRLCSCLGVMAMIIASITTLVTW